MARANYGLTAELIYSDRINKIKHDFLFLSQRHKAHGEVKSPPFRKGRFGGI